MGFDFTRRWKFHVDISDIVIVGAGAAQLTVASLLQRSRPSLTITLIDPADYQSYQPAGTLVGRA